MLSPHHKHSDLLKLLSCLVILTPLREIVGLLSQTRRLLVRWVITLSHKIGLPSEMYSNIPVTLLRHQLKAKLLKPLRLELLRIWSV